MRRPTISSGGTARRAGRRERALWSRIAALWRTGSHEVGHSSRRVGREVGEIVRERARVRQAVRRRRRIERRERTPVREGARPGRAPRLGWFLAAGSLCVAALTAGVVASPVMSLQTIEVSGTQRLDAGSVEQALADLRGRPMAGVSRVEVGDRLERLPEIETYTTESELPGTLRVRIRERTPVGLYRSPVDGKYLLVDAAGVAIASSEKPVGGQPLLRTPSSDPTDPAFASAAEVVLALPTDLRGEVREVRAGTQDDVRLSLKGGMTVIWGDHSESDLKAKVLERLLETDPKASSIDVSSPRAPSVQTR